MSNDPLLQPYTLKHLTFRNRIMTTSHEPAYAEDGMPKARYRAYHVERAKAGIALTMTAGSAAISKDSPPVFNNILAYRDEVVPWMKDLVDECHEHGAKVMIQLTHLGRRTRWDKGDWLPAVSPSHAREPAHRAFPKKLEEWDRERIVRDYADAAERMKAAGLDGIELEAYGHLMDQFWSPLTNTLDAPYGGSLENRMRFTFDVLSAIRKRVGDAFIVGIRYTADEMITGGLTREEGMQLSMALKSSGLIDFLNVIRGHLETDAGLTDIIPIMGMNSAPHLDFAGELRNATDFPTFHAARIQDVATARHAINSGKVDMIGMTRAHMTDPHIVRKIIERREDDIRPCVGANYCLDRIYQGGAAFCIHNAATGRETTMPHTITPAHTKRKIVIVGAGPAGLEAARVAGERGHDVVVFEATGHPGGQVRLTAQTPRRKEMLGIIDWRMAQCERLGVRFAFNTWADASTVLDERPDVVIVATGGMPDIEVLTQGVEHVVSAWDILSGDVKPGSNVLIYDDAGDHPALQAAETIAHAGGAVEIMTPDRSFSPEVMSMNLVPYMRSLQKLNAKFTVTYRLEAVRREGNELVAIVGSDYGGIRKEQRYDQIVVNHGTIPMDELYFALKAQSTNLGAVNYDDLIDGKPQIENRNPAGRFQLFRIGDAVSARNTHAAIYDALRLVKDL
ncbi:NADH:flavin oxidoreductase [Paraburkholderia silvatlantica]|uniref:2,4-dienoyl-CoA reductase-like NADH-dependent reductase (Old Yellow Enzyme family)/thioredoxin reductase n=1 Tax=Paraburkholderia silvatlantica TaxID=321895 RepID=A0ABR6FM71_9BURK|nr:NADH:flavin oxidoreductase [Paraburkholderia silvatlantica]MBB2927885.1 2,4-dienoyl-CoA reductase-like NADH-dependent reductase (Old Yellow Enzyme family)/thioredoxin reductase [Paraburkholderia silvatlantica]PVY27551.1 2,4-dienoyl-CoA reductase-like NADH-dependent reductase (Old Yellow Enzyme family) [Paraburkholderia silvatlantica]PXW34524.1 2,4-dienoyl-CoA reductase-like NADH-dependent reductase (Old Yellow Enzyme family) [Paraburkholderia silvatlantica]